jgi:hypothetical protein
LKGGSKRGGERVNAGGRGSTVAVPALTAIYAVNAGRDAGNPRRPALTGGISVSRDRREPARSGPLLASASTPAVADRRSLYQR